MEKFMLKKENNLEALYLCVMYKIHHTYVH